ncbi:MAG: hypothetical protein ACK4TA_20440 [Saprospiraceae bacterium]
MSRKKFTDDIGNLFGDDDADILSEESVLLAATSASDKKRNQPGRSSQGKHFTADLESFLKEAFEESYEAQTQGESRAAIDSQLKKRSRRPPGGLDLLIRSTIEPVAVADSDSHTRRVTLLFEQKKLEKLKTIARLERTYLKDIIDELVWEYIQEYEQEKGRIE